MNKLQERYVAVLQASAGNRRLLENSYTSLLKRDIVPLYRKLTSQMVQDKTLSYLSERARRSKVEFRGDRREISRQSDEDTLELLYFSDTLSASSEIKVARGTFRRFNILSYEYGAVSASRALGFDVRSRKVDKLDTAFSKATPIEFSLTDEEIISQLENRVYRFGSGITAAVIEDARKIIKEELYLGNASIDEVVDAIVSRSSIPEWRALKIARTEIQESFQTARYDMHDRSGVANHTWFSVGDRRVRPAHRDNDGITVPIGKEFPSGQLHPGDNVEGLAINCRCSTIPDLSSGLLLKPWEGNPTLRLRESRLRS